MSIIYYIVISFLCVTVQAQVICGGGCTGSEIWGGFCYCLSNSGLVDTWTNHESWCSSNFASLKTGEGHISSVHSFEEIEYIRFTFTGFASYFWVGLEEATTYGDNSCSWTSCEWSDGSPNDYDMILSCSLAAPKCLAYYRFTKALHDFSCTANHKAVCKYELFCYDVQAGDPNVCSGRGTCFSDNVCSCQNGFFGDQCEVSICYDHYSNDTGIVCSGNGNCSSTNNCLCERGYSGANCSVWMEGLCEDSTDRYQGYCYENFGPGLDYNDAEDSCNSWVDYVESHLLSFHSKEEEEWIRANKLTTGLGWLGLTKYPSGSLFPCPPDFGYDWTDGTNTSWVDGKNSISLECDSNDLCIVFSGDSGKWTDHDCSSTLLSTICKYKIPQCFGYFSYEVTSVCSGRGKCVSEDNCTCTTNTFGENCEKWKCYGYMNTDIVEVCSGHGNCLSEDNCDCENGYVGSNCDTTTCAGLPEGHSDVCNGRGSCYSPDVCSCDQGFGGKNCQFFGGCDETTGGTDDEKNFDPINGWTCYKRSNNILPFYQAEDWCILDWDGGLPGNHLVSINNEVEWDFIHISLVTDNTIIGLYKNEDTTDCYDDTKLEFTDGTDPSWLVGSGKTMNCLSDTDLALMVTTTDDYVQDLVTTSINHFVCKRIIPVCFGEQGFEHSKVCSGRGLCIYPDECLCSSPLEYFGAKCNITTCYGILNNETKNVCSGKGTCWPKDTCFCEEGYIGSWCDVTTCDDVYSNITSVCSSHGTCWGKDICNCDEGYFGERCNITTCNNIMSNDTINVCRGHGTCISKDVCSCQPSSDYYGNDCENTFCNGIGSDSKYPRVCSGRGSCYPLEHCNCIQGYYGDSCNTTTCNDVFSNHTNDVCSGKGICWPLDRCKCNEYFYGTFCDGNHPCAASGEYENKGYCYTNFGVMGNYNESELVCNEWFPGAHLLSINSTEEELFVTKNITILHSSFPIFTGAKKRISGSAPPFSLYPCPMKNGGGYVWSDGEVDEYLVSKGSNVSCSTNESCIAINITQFIDVDCDEVFNEFSTACKFKIPICYGIQANFYQTVCSGHGFCYEDNNCTCIDDGKDYYGKFCNHTFCNGIDSQDNGVCNQHGNCYPLDICTCTPPYYFGEFCEITSCNGVWNNQTNDVCSGHGTCDVYDICNCFNSYFGDDCDVTTCFGKYSNDSDVCNNQNGNCTSLDHCDCLPNMVGDECEITSCDGVFSNETTNLACSSFGDCISFDVCNCDLSSVFMNGSSCQNLFIPTSSFPKLISTYNSIEIKSEFKSIVFMEYCDDIKIRFYGVDERIEFECNSTDSETQNEIDLLSSKHEKNITMKKKAGWMNITIRPIIRNSSRGGDKVIFGDQIFYFYFYKYDDVLESIEIDGPDTQYTFYNSPNFELSVHPVHPSQCNVESDAFQSYHVIWKQINWRKTD